ncbi:ADP-ribosylglycohydrolase family protein [Ralstonia edaphi]|uniref:ADP-ribosylglycohydrolase family protein n=1 Tax=Ralstonia edaphi TaxID=3058599 RepID=UPI00292F6F46|nr:ADP-ribosylglycohydrolase family protein [Ralstonia sp. LMG 6871]
MTDTTTGFASLLPDHSANPFIGGIVGLLIGDAVGVPFEFHQPEDLPDQHQIEMVPPVGFRRAHAGVPPGTWSDDGSQALCLLASLAECGKFTLTDFSARLLRWLDHGYMAVDGDVFDVGNQTYDALDRLRDGASPRESGGNDEHSNGNGSLMRVLPLALWNTGTDEELVRDAHFQSLPTHAHPRSLVACAFYCLVARAFLNRHPDPWVWAERRLADIYGDWSNVQERRTLLHELDVLRSFPKDDQPRGSGYVLDTIWSTHKAMNEDSFENVVKTAIMFGNDTDTTAAVAGGLAGIRYGVAGIPARWLAQLRGFELVEPLIARCAIGCQVTNCP